MVVRKVRVSHYHRLRLVSEQLRYREKIRSGHHESAGKSMPQAMPSKVFDLGFVNCRLEPRMQTAPSAEDKFLLAVIVETTANQLQTGANLGSTQGPSRQLE